MQDLSFALSPGPLPPPGAPLVCLSRLEALHMLGLQSCQLVSINGSLQARGRAVQCRTADYCVVLCCAALRCAALFYATAAAAAAKLPVGMEPPLC